MADKSKEYLVKVRDKISKLADILRLDERQHLMLLEALPSLLKNAYLTGQNDGIDEAIEKLVDTPRFKGH